MSKTIRTACLIVCSVLRFGAGAAASEELFTRWSPDRGRVQATAWESDAPDMTRPETFDPWPGVDNGALVVDGPAPPPVGPHAYGPDDCFDELAGRGPLGPWEPGWWLRDLSLFAGVHGFKGPADRGRNGNFGFQEGVNFGAPLGVCDWGWQIGAAAVHSNFSGDRAIEDHADVRNQFFFTGGLFKRAKDWGMQWGVTYDWLHDEYYHQTDLKQIRSDTSLLLPGGKREIGYFGAYGTGGTSFVLIGRQAKYYIMMEPTDIFAFYYRRYFEGGGDGRAWIGFSGRGDGILGAELRVPMGKSWALENRINYLMPKHSGGESAAIQESWGVTIQLVWYPGQKARCIRYHQYRPMLSVADNTLFMTDTFVPSGL